MIGLSKISSAVLFLLLPFAVMAQEQAEVEILTPTNVVETVTEVAGVVEVANPVISELLPEPVVVIVEQVTPPPSEAEILLARAKAENAKRANMRTAQLTETECLALAMYHEARGEGTVGMKSVAFVIHNRVNSGRYPTSYCSVILQRSQFSFTADRNPDNIKSWDSFAKALALSVELLDNNGFETEKSPVGSAMYFHSLRKASNWVYASGRKFIATIGNHHFFK